MYADRLARRGYDLVLVARSSARLETVAARVKAETGRHIEVLVADLVDRVDLARVEARLRSTAEIEVLVNNAGVGAPVPTWQAAIDPMTQMIDINITALTRLTYAAVPGFVARGHGAIINIGSVVGLAPEFMLNSVYGGSKAYVLALTQSLQLELAGTGVRVQAVLPGAIATDFWDLSGVPLSGVTPESTMSAADMVDAALAGFDLDEMVTLPSLPDIVDWESFEAARTALLPNLSRTDPAPRYRTAATPPLSRRAPRSAAV